MQCDLCHRTLAPDEPVWFVSVGYFNRIFANRSTGRICRQCCERQGWLNAYWMEWRSPQPCEQCGRALHWPSRRKLRKHFVCSAECARRLIIGHLLILRIWISAKEAGPSPCAEIGPARESPRRPLDGPWRSAIYFIAASSRRNIAMEERDSATFRIWLWPAPGVPIKTVCLDARRAPDPSATGCRNDRDTVPCKSWPDPGLVTE